MVLGWSWGDFRGFILNRNCNLFERKRLVFENGIANCNTKKECRNPGFGDQKDCSGTDYSTSALGERGQTFCHFAVLPENIGLALYSQTCKIVPTNQLSNQPPDNDMRIFLSLSVSLLVGSVLLLSGCADRPELSPSAYGTILRELPDLEEANAPFPFPIGADGNCHQHCVFDEFDDFF